ncbi:MAG TPA: hypothetical protein DCF44_09270 [Chitinophagaceae bacterium]|nr:hypothetical protein [Chitinophagaceae bacterium]
MQYEFKVAPEVVLRNEDLKDGYIIPDISVKKRESTWNQPEMIIEVTRNRSWLGIYYKKSRRKCR